MTALPQSGDTTRFQAGELCEKAGIPEAFTRKVFQSLVQAGILRALRGPGGGYEFARPLCDITLLDIVRAIDGEDAFNVCAMGLMMCGNLNPCPLHEAWAPFKTKLIEELQRKTLADLLSFAATGIRLRQSKSPSRCLCRQRNEGCRESTEQGDEALLKVVVGCEEEEVQ